MDTGPDAGLVVHAGGALGEGAGPLTAARRRARGEAGYVAGELALGIGLLVFPVAMLVLTLPTWAERQLTARSIAREAARVVAVAGVCDTGAATGVGATMSESLGLRGRRVEVALDCASGQRLPRGGTVTASVTVHMPAVDVPGIGSVGAWSWTAHHREPVDQYRSFG